MSKIYFLLNDLKDFNAKSYFETHLPSCEIFLGTCFPKNPRYFDLIVPWNYQKIIKNYYSNIVIFHSSDLPKGKGWAPIFNAFDKELDEYVISAILLDKCVDSGDIIAKAKFKMKNTYTAKFIRLVDEEVTMMMIARILKKFKGVKLVGIKQDSGKENYYKRRYPEDNKLNINSNLQELIPVLKGCEANHPAFFEYNGDKFIISIEPQSPPVFPDDLKVTFTC
jgi:methionyl-tRNA formyltransferase